MVGLFHQNLRSKQSLTLPVPVAENPEAPVQRERMTFP